MRNELTPASIDHPQASLEGHRPVAKRNTRVPFGRLRDDRRRTGGMTDDLPAKPLSPTSDFEDFGSFAS